MTGYAALIVVIFLMIFSLRKIRSASAERRAIEGHTVSGVALPEPPFDEFGYSGRYTLHVAGEQFSNKHGVKRQSVIMNMSRGDALMLVREPRNRFDNNAVRIDWRGYCIGYISAKNAVWVSRVMDEGFALEASVSDIFPDSFDGHTFLNVMIFLDRVPPKHRPKPMTVLLEFLDRVDQERKTWKGQRNWLLRAKEMASSYLSVFWISEQDRNNIVELIKSIDGLLLVGDSTKKKLNIDVTKTGCELEMSASWGAVENKKSVRHSRTSRKPS